MKNENRLIYANDLSKKTFICDEVAEVRKFINNAPTVDAIPIAVMKRMISGINAADQCDQAGRYDYELRNALKTVLNWYDSPLYKECERRTHK